MEIPLKPRQLLRGKWPKSQKSRSNNKSNKGRVKLSAQAKAALYQGEKRYLYMQDAGRGSVRMVTESELAILQS